MARRVRKCFALALARPCILRAGSLSRRCGMSKATICMGMLPQCLCVLGTACHLYRVEEFARVPAAIARKPEGKVVQARAANVQNAARSWCLIFLQMCPIPTIRCGSQVDSGELQLFRAMQSMSSTRNRSEIPLTNNPPRCQLARDPAATNICKAPPETAAPGVGSVGFFAVTPGQDS